MTVERGQAAPEVEYDGTPRFRAVEGTDLSIAINSPFQVIHADEGFFLCHEAAWFAGQGAKGPWQVADAVPADIYGMPPSCPLYRVVYVRVHETTPTHVVFAYTSGYLDSYYDESGSVVYGTGWYHEPYVGWETARVYPVYFPWPVTYGIGAYYNPYTGTYWRGGRAQIYGPYGGLGRCAAYHPGTGTYLRGAAVWGPHGGRAWAEAYSPRNGVHARTVQGRTLYAGWGATTYRRGSEWAHTAHHRGGGRVAAGYRTSGGDGGFVGRTPQGDIYAGADGNVYRRTDDGWQRYDGNGWQEMPQARVPERARGSAAHREAVRGRPRASDASMVWSQPPTTTQPTPRSMAMATSDIRRDAMATSDIRRDAMAPSDVRADAMSTAYDIRRSGMGAAATVNDATMRQLQNDHRLRTSGNAGYNGYRNYKQYETAIAPRPTKPAESRAARPARPARPGRPSRAIVGAGR